MKTRHQRLLGTVISCVSVVVSMCVLAAPKSQITDAVRPFIERHELAGVVTVVADKDKVLDVQTLGYADVGARRRMQTDTLFWIASMSKPITAAALMMLVDEGKVSIDDPVDKYLPEFERQKVIVDQTDSYVVLKRPNHAITIKNLLTHTSGLPPRTAAETPVGDHLPLNVLTQLYATIPLQFEPGTRDLYSNVGINAVGRIVEVVSGMPFQRFLDERIFRPLGMKDTTFWPSVSQLRRLAKSYAPNAAGPGIEVTEIDQLHYPLNDRGRAVFPAGGLFSTAMDLTRFCQMILNSGIVDGHRYLSESAIELMTHNQRGPQDQKGYGLGWDTARSGSFGHGGAYATHMTIDRSHGLILIWLVQAKGIGSEGDRSREAFEKAALEVFGR